MNVADYILHTRELTSFVPRLVSRIIIEENAILGHSLSADERKASDLLKKLVAVTDALHRYDTMVLHDIKEPEHVKQLLHIDHLVREIKVDLEKVSRSPPLKAADLLLHSEIIDRVDNMRRVYENELDALQKLLKKKAA